MPLYSNIPGRKAVYWLSQIGVSKDLHSTAWKTIANFSVLEWRRAIDSELD